MKRTWITFETLFNGTNIALILEIYFIRIGGEYEKGK